jgi:ribulose-5-phosphate 4-epimerase/fuculose-1-phosphate aldolase
MSKAFLRVTTQSQKSLRRLSTMSTKMDSVEQALRRDLAIAHRLIAHNNQDELIWNHISARDPSWEKGKYLVTPGDKHFALIEPCDLVLMGESDNNDKNTLNNVTADVIHGAIYKVRPDVNAIVHIHSEAGMYVSTLDGDDPLKFYTQDAGGFYGKIQWHEFCGVAADFKEQELIQNDITRRTKQGYLPDILMMRQHGTTACGSSVGAAYVKNFYLDRVCRVQMNVDQSNAATNAAEISDDILKLMAKQFDSTDFKHGCEWPAMVKYAEKYLGAREF